MTKKAKNITKGTQSGVRKEENKFFYTRTALYTH